MYSSISQPDYISISAATDTGKVREHNEDSFAACADLDRSQWAGGGERVPLSPAGSLLAVADGIGGALAGEVASRIAVETVQAYFSPAPFTEAPPEKEARAYLQRVVRAAHGAILDYGDTHPQCEGMGTTLILAWVTGRTAYLAWRGDSRGYLYRPGTGIRMLTEDHSLVWDYVKAGRLTPEEADVHPLSNIILKSLGNREVRDTLPDIVAVPLQPGDRLLLCSDGLNNMVSTREIARIVGHPGVPLPEINRQLIEAANANGGRDNITVALLELFGPGA